jgi:hypothetical protein
MLDKVILQNTYKNINNKDELSNVVEGLFIQGLRYIQVFSFKHDVMIKVLEYEIKTINVINAMRLIMFIDITKLTNNDVNYYVN